MLKLPLDEQSSIMLFGPRGTGKTHWLTHQLPDAIYIDLLSFNLFNQLSQNPSHLNHLIPPAYTDWIIIDEIQRIPALLNEVHRLIESQGYRFILTGSSARSLRKKGVNLLAGRALTYHMHPLIPQELGDDFVLTHILKFGSLPTTFRNSNPKKYLETYVETYLREEVLQEGLIRNVGAFTSFLEVASFSQGSTINMSEIAREIGVDRSVVANYFSITRDLLLSTELPIFSKRAKRRLISKSKFYFFDVGVYRTLRFAGPLDSTSELEGVGLETYFLQVLRALNDYLNLGYRIYFWQTSTGIEVDFIVYGPRGLHAFEIKRTRSVAPKHLKGLQTFAQDYPESSCYLISMTEAKEYHGNIQVIPMNEALKELIKIL